MERVDIIKSYPWYHPAHVAMWQQRQGCDVEPITELIVMNHPEAVAQREEVDMAFLISLVEQPLSIPPKEPAMDAISSLKMMTPVEVKRSASSDLIDKFLEVKDLRIVSSSDEDDQVKDLMWEEANFDQPFTAEDDLASEELARIYLNQKLYSEASDIYNRLFLLYSEKSVYFATQIENIAKILEKSDENSGN